MYVTYYTRFGTPRAKFYADKASQFDCAAGTLDPIAGAIAEARAELAANYWARETGMLAGVVKFDAQS